MATCCCCGVKDFATTLAFHRKVTAKSLRIALLQTCLPCVFRAYGMFRESDLEYAPVGYRLRKGQKQC